MDHFHRSIVTRIFLAWLILSLVTVAGALVLGVHRFDRMAETLAMAEAQRFAPGSAGAHPPRYQPEQVEAYARSFEKRSCVRLKVFKPDGHLLLETDNPRFQALLPGLEGKLRVFPPDGKHHVHRFELAGHPVVQLILPLDTGEGPPHGFFEMVVVLDPEALGLVKADLRRSTLLVLLSVAATALLLYPLLHALNRQVLRSAAEVVKGNLEIASVLGEAIAQRDSDTGEHNYRVSLYAIRLAEAIGAGQVDMRALVLGAFLHDVGKIGISDNILLKPGRLTAEEFEVMHTHVNLGTQIIGSSHWLQAARDVIEFHHERFDGRGYQKGLRGEAIPLVARIFAVVDVFDALTSRRPYKEPFPFDESLASLEADAGSHFDPRLVAAFRTIAEEAYRTIHLASEAELKAWLRSAVAGHRGRSGKGLNAWIT